MFWKRWLCSSVEQTSCVLQVTPLIAPPICWPRRRGRACKWNFCTITNSQVCDYVFVSLFSADTFLNVKALKPDLFISQIGIIVTILKDIITQKDEKCLILCFNSFQEEVWEINLFCFFNLRTGRLKYLILHNHFSQKN